MWRAKVEDSVTEDPEAVASRADLMPIDDIVVDLRALRERGLVMIRHTELPALRAAAARAMTVGTLPAGLKTAPAAAASTGVAGTGVAGTGVAGTGVAGTGVAGTGVAGTGVAGTAQAGPPAALDTGPISPPTTPSIGPISPPTTPSIGPRAIEALVRVAVNHLDGGDLGTAAVHTFGLAPGDRDKPAQDRRRKAALAYNVSLERFRKHHEKRVIEQVAEKIMELCQPLAAGPEPGPAGSPRPQDGPPERGGEVRLTGRVRGARFPVTVHLQPVELLRDVDVVIAPANVYLELPQPYKASVSAALRRASARHAADGSVVADEVADELRAWITANGRPGMPVAEGTVAATSSGAMADQGIRRIYHAAIAAPRPGTNDYDVQPTAIARAVGATFTIARAERGRFSPPLGSLCFPLLGSGRGGLAAATSFDWIWAALEHEVRADNTWEIHFIAHRKAVAEVIVAGITRSGGTAVAAGSGHSA
jgi:hypothetical protein